MKSIKALMQGFVSPECITSNVVSTERERLQKLADRENASVGDKDKYDGYNCSLCKNKGYTVKVVGDDRLAELVQCTCVCEKARRSIRNLKASGLERVVKEYRFDNFKADEPWQQEALALAKRFISDEDNHWFFMGGQSGAGKTHLCSALAIEFLRKCREVKYMLWKDESRRIKNDNFNGGELIETYKNADILYIDDLFKVGKAYGEDAQKPTAGDINIAFEILNSRVAQKKMTIISSESDLKELLDIDVAVAGRIKQMCGEYCINIARSADKNYRLRDL